MIIAVGARFDDRVTGRVEHFAPDAKIIHIDIDPTSISKNIRVDIPIVGAGNGPGQAEAKTGSGLGAAPVSPVVTLENAG